MLLLQRVFRGMLGRCRANEHRLRTNLSAIVTDASCVLAAAYCLLRTGRCILAAAYWPLRTGCCVLAAAYWLLRTGCCVLAAAYWLLRTGCVAVELWGRCRRFKRLCAASWVCPMVPAGGVTCSVYSQADGRTDQSDEGCSSLFDAVCMSVSQGSQVLPSECCHPSWRWA